MLGSSGFSYSSVGKESACNVGDRSLSPGSGRSAAEEIGYPCQCSWASLVAQLVKNPPAMQETHGEGELVITLESWEVTRSSRGVEEGLSRSFSLTPEEDTEAQRG